MSNQEGRIVSTLQGEPILFPLKEQKMGGMRYDRILIDWSTYNHNFGKGSALKDPLQTSIGITLIICIA